MVKGASGNCCASTRKIVSLSARSVHLRQQHVNMQPRRLSRAAGKLCRKHAWNARSKQRHVPDTKQVLLWKGWVLKQRLNDVQSRVGVMATRAHVQPALRTELFVDSCSVRHQYNCCASTHEIPATWISICTQGTQRCSCDKIAALARHKHILGSLSVRKETCSGEKTAAFSRCEHTWTSFRAQRDMFHRRDCCALTPRAHLDLSPCASKRTCSCDKLLRSHATSTRVSLRAQRDMFHKAIAAFSRREHTWISLRAQRDMSYRKDCCDFALPPKIDDFYLRTPDPISTVKRAHVPYVIGNP